MKLYRVQLWTIGQNHDEDCKHDFLVRNARSSAGAIRKALAWVLKYHPESHKIIDHEANYAFELKFNSAEVIEL